MTLIYNYHHTYGYYTNFSEADESPLEPGVFLLPAHATFVAPPDDIPANKVAMWDPEEGEWFITKDWRGVYYSKKEPWSDYFENLDPMSKPDLKRFALGPVPDTKYQEEVFYNEETEKFEVREYVKTQQDDTRLEFVREFVNQLDIMGISIEDLKKMLNTL